MTIDQNQLRLLPSIDELLHASVGQQLIERYSRAMTVQTLRGIIAQVRKDIRQGAACPPATDILAMAEQRLQQEQLPHLRPVINATGVIINTNLGRAPLSAEALQAVQRVASGYSNLEYASGGG